jgi:hypothetical protein
VIDESTSVSDTVDAVDAVSDLSESVSIDDFADLESPIDGVDELGFSEVDDVTDSGLPDAEDLADKASGGGILGGVFDLF